jgi:hypothetical protein
MILDARRATKALPVTLRAGSAGTGEDLSIRK